MRDIIELRSQIYLYHGGAAALKHWREQRFCIWLIGLNRKNT